MIKTTVSKGSTRLAAGNCAGSANDVNVTSKILAVNFSVLRPRKNDVTVALSSFLRSGVRKCSLVDPLVLKKSPIREGFFRFEVMTGGCLDRSLRNH